MMPNEQSKPPSTDPKNPYLEGTPKTSSGPDLITNRQKSQDNLDHVLIHENYAICVSFSCKNTV